ncbi:MAG: hypothetical protein Q9191_008177 [Dirinaria sp. TL-2023a]
MGDGGSKLAETEDKALETSANGGGAETEETASEQRSEMFQHSRTSKTDDGNQTKALIPVLAEHDSPQKPQRFRFVGYFRILNLDFLKPHSSELIRMLDQKWTTTTKDSSTEQANAQGYTKRRNPDRWAESLGQEWAVLKLEEIDGSGLEAPKIERQGEI